ncbi:Trp biosynthesis-associated membrane protein [Pseudactinotalea terrae]|uniref:Trp biosynthesis-associated membrane protein n=1 Tax=Pseudactinotalea terrae TaxID=1743262 RepID=UPI0012E2DA3E|nr:Trp biosynthesis-associated membrane protein [Pseudactinotalea terrae]
MTGSLGRGRAVLIVVVLGIALFGLTLPAWAHAVAPTTVGSEAVTVAGSDAAPGVASAGLVVLVSGLVLGLAGALARVLAVLGVIAGGALAAVSAGLFLADPERSVLRAAAEITGVRQVDGPITVAPWPTAALVVGAVAVLTGLALPFLAGSWQRVGRRYERGTDAAARATPTPPRTPRGRAMDDWDALTRGDDPSHG